jgi:hypothetical protein
VTDNGKLRGGKMDEDPIQPINVTGEASGDTQKPKDKPPATSVNIGNVDPLQDASTPYTDTKKRKRKPLTCFEVWTVVLASIGILVAAGTGAAIIWQDIIASTTLGELQKQYPQLEETADGAKRAADAAEKSFRADERPYITISSIDPKTGPLKDGENSLDFSIFNSGKTPALRVEHTLNVIVSEKKIKLIVPNGKSEGVLPGNRISTNNYTLRLSPGDAKNVANLRLEGSIQYVDVIDNTPYTTTFCAWYDVKVSQFKFCPYGNDVK